KFGPVFVLCALGILLAGCSGFPKSNGGGGGGGTGSIAVTMAVANTLPANPNILSFTVSISSIVFTPTAGPSQTVTLNPVRVVDLARLQTDTAFLGTFGNIPATTYSSVTVTMGLPAQMTFLNDTGATISSLNGTALSPTCPNNAICQVTLNLSGSPFSTFSFTVPSSGTLGLGLSVDLSAFISVV